MCTREDRFQEYRTMARLIPRALGLFANVQLIFVIGSKPALLKEKDMAPDER